jgi:hypothetical protein
MARTTELTSYRRNRASQITVVIGGWALFIWMWRQVLLEVSAITVLRAAEVLGITLLVVGTLTTWWVMHNVRIFRRKGPRTGLRAVTSVFERDFVGRALVADWDELRTATCIEITAEDRSKRYGVDDGLVPARAALATITSR